MKRYVFNSTGMEEHYLGSWMLVSELRELIGKQMAEDYCGKMSNTEVQHREKFRGELLAELSDSRQAALSTESVYGKRLAQSRRELREGRGIPHKEAMKQACQKRRR
jgi:hypothetical protein